MSPNALIPLPTPAYLANCRWIQAEMNRLVRQYTDQWIAVDQGRVLAAGPDLGRVTAAAQRASQSADVAYEFIAGSSMIF